MEEGLIEIENGSFLVYNGFKNNNSNILENDGFNIFYQTNKGSSFVNLFTLRNPSDFPLYTNLAFQNYNQPSFGISMKFFDGTEWISVSELTANKINTLKICFFIQYYEQYSNGIAGAYAFGHEAFIHGSKKYFITKQILEQIGNSSNDDIALAFNHLIYSGSFETGFYGSKDHALFIEGKKTDMNDFIKQLIQLRPDKLNEIFEELKDELWQYSNPAGGYEEIENYFQSSYNKSSVQMVQQFLQTEFEEYYEEYFEDWYNRLVINCNN